MSGSTETKEMTETHHGKVRSRPHDLAHKLRVPSDANDACFPEMELRDFYGCDFL